jgi:hypothetical protein
LLLGQYETVFCLKETSYQVEISFLLDQYGEKSVRQGFCYSRMLSISHRIVSEATSFFPGPWSVELDKIGVAGSCRWQNKTQFACQTSFRHTLRML